MTWWYIFVSRYKNKDTNIRIRVLLGINIRKLIEEEYLVDSDFLFSCG